MSLMVGLEKMPRNGFPDAVNAFPPFFALFNASPSFKQCSLHAFMRPA